MYITCMENVKLNQQNNQAGDHPKEEVGNCVKFRITNARKQAGVLQRAQG